MAQASSAETNQQRLLNIVAAHLQGMLDNEERKERTGARINRVLFKDLYDAADDSAVPMEAVSPEEEVTFRLLQSFLDISQMVTAVEQCGYYFRRYPFRGLPVSRTDHLRNCCEMYFDRIVQFRDRLKRSLNLCKNEGVIDSDEISRLLKIFDRVFLWEHKQRNRTHHQNRFDYIELNQLSIAEMVGAKLPSEVQWLVNPKRLFRIASGQWVERIQSRTDGLAKITEHVCGIMLSCPSILSLK